MMQMHGMAAWIAPQVLRANTDRISDNIDLMTSDGSRPAK
jgi:hypothetical protein